MNILAFCAHPDDIELNVGGTLLKYKKQGHKIFIALTTSGNTGSNIMTDVEEIGRVREAEMMKSAALFGAEVRFLRNDDERLLDTNETRTQVLDAMRWADPDVIQRKGTRRRSLGKRLFAGIFPGDLFSGPESGHQRRLALQLSPLCFVHGHVSFRCGRV